MTKKKLYIGDCIGEIDTGSNRRKPSLKIVFHPCLTEDHNILIKGLLQRMVNPYGAKVPIRALCLTWDEYEEDFE